MTTPTPEATEGWKFDRRFSVDKKYAGRYARAVLRYGLLAPENSIGPLSLLTILVLFAAVNVGTSGALQRAAVFAAGAAGFIVLFYLLLCIGMWGAARRWFPAGSELTMAFGEGAVHFGSLRGTQNLDIQRITEVVSCKGFVLARRGTAGHRRIRSRQLAQFSMWPEELFTPSSLAYLREQVAIANR